MKNNCLNCNELITGNFCSNCGQKKYKRIDRKYIWDEIQYTLLHTNKGFLYSVKKILKNPGKTAKEFVEGNRVNHYKPILLAFVLSGISAFISLKIVGLNAIMKDILSKKGMYSDFMNDVISFSSSYNSLIMLMLIPVFALLTKLVFSKWGHNYYEHVVMNSYILSFYMLFNIILYYPLLFAVRNNIGLFELLSFGNLLIIPLIMIWFYNYFYPEATLKSIILRILLLLAILFVGYIALIFAATILYLLMYGQEAIHHLQLK